MAIVDTTLAPKYAIEVEGQGVDSNVARYVRGVEYESCDGMADIGRIRADNPGHIISNAKMFQPGNEASLYMGYGADVSLTHIGRMVIQRNIPFYPQDGMPTIQIIGYTKDVHMMDNSPEESKKRRFKDTTYADAVEQVATVYGFETDIDPTPDAPHDFIQKAGLTDYDFVQGLANLTGSTFWVDGDSNGVWTLHFRDPATIEEQDKIYTFKYNEGDLSSLLSFRPDLLIKDAKTKITVVTKDRGTGRIIRSVVEEENDASPDVAAEGDPTGDVSADYTTGSDIKLFFGDFSFDVITHKHFRTEADVIHWAQQWFRRMRENFILATGKTIGTELLMARQRHNLDGISPAYVGEYYFSKVKHMLNDTSGYMCDFAARKVVPE